ncbi:MAG: hypothetical protein DHS20C08_10510 [Rhodomicrobium sp.]|nr:MAG: hypothetical protein DHS20C08_10510 [Rhodomicrobium sp.]
MTTSKARISAAATIALAMLLINTSSPKAHDFETGTDIKNNQTIHLAEVDVVPDAELDYAKEKKFDGPKKTKGIKSARLMGTVSLAGQFKDIENRKLRAREIDIEPGGVVAVHRHDQRPGVAYMVKGQLTEHRRGEKAPVVKKAGDSAFEKTGVTHWWINEGNTIARIIVVDIVPNDVK